MLTVAEGWSMYAAGLLSGVFLLGAAHEFTERMIERRRRKLAERTISGLRDFAEKLANGDEIPCTIFTVEQTPDGPLTTQEESTLDDYIDRQKSGLATE